MWSRISNSSFRNIRFLDIFPDGYDNTIIHAVWMFYSICDWLPDCLSSWAQSTEFRKHFLGFVSKCFIEFHYFANSTHLLAFIWHSIQLLWAGAVSHCRRHWRRFSVDMIIDLFIRNAKKMFNWINCNAWLRSLNDNYLLHRRMEREKTAWIAAIDFAFLIQTQEFLTELPEKASDVTRQRFSQNNIFHVILGKALNVHASAKLCPI